MGLILLVVAVLAPPGWAQDASSEQTGEYPVVSTEISLGGLAATNDLVPFWLQAGRHGRWARHGTQGGVLASVSVDGSIDRLSYSGRVEIAGRIGSSSPTGFLHQAYARAERGIFRTTAGRVAHLAGLVDTTLTAGSMMWSTNAPPVPRLSVSWPTYVPVPGTDGYVSFKGYLAHGWMGSSRYVDAPYLHEKYVYVRLLPPRFPIQVHGGVVHNAIWAGSHPTSGDLPDGFDDFVTTFLGYRPDRGDTAQDLGNTVAIYDFGITYDLGPAEGILYREFYIEDKPALWFRSPWDGLWGASVHLEDRSLALHGLLWEHVYTVRQGSRYADGEEPGADNYYNHSVYSSGWSYQGRTIGNPLLFSRDEVVGVANNRLVAHHVGLEGSLGPLVDYRLLATFSRSYGARRILVRGPDGGLVAEDGDTGRRDQLSYLLDLRGRIGPHPLEVQVNLALDLGETHPDAFGVLAGLTYRPGR